MRHIKKEGATSFEFYNGDRWVPLTKQTAEFFAPKTLRDRFDGVNTTESFLGVDKTPPALEDLLMLELSLRVNYQQI